MSYIKQAWKTGDVISADKLNHIESGLEAVDKEQGPAGITPQLQNSGTAIQVSYDEGQSYSDLVQLSQITGPQGPAGEGFSIYKTYASVTDMEADAANVEDGKFVMIASSEDDPDNAKLYVKSGEGFSFVSDLSGAQGIQGPQGEPGVQGPQGEPGKNGVTPVITVEATQLAYDQPISVVKSGTDAEPHFTFGIPAGQPGKDAELPDNLVTYSDFTYGDQQRKTIQLANYDSISGVATDGTGYNIAMVSKWDKVDLGAPALTMNLNSKDGQVQINDEKIIATVDQIPDVSGFALKTDVDQALEGKQDKGDYALKSELVTPEEVVASEPMQDALNTVRSEIPTMEEIATSPEVSGLTAGLVTEGAMNSALEGKQDKGDYATNEVVQAEFESYDKTIKTYIDSKLTAVYTYKGSVANEQALPAQDQTVGDVYNVENTGKNVAWDGEKWDELGATIDLSAYAKTEDVNAQLATKAAVEHTHEIADVDGLQNTLDSKTVTVGNVGANKDTVEIKQGETSLAKLAIPYHPLKVNASLFIDDGSFYDPEGGLGGHPDYFNNTAWSGGDSLTEEQLAQGPFLLITGTNTVSGEQTTVETNLVPLGKDSALGKFYATKEELATKADAVHTHEIADVTGLQAILDLMPVEIKLPIRTGIGGFQDKLYTQEEIFAWFGVTDLSGFLALAKSTRQVWISYVVSASFQTSAYRYLANYIEYVPSSKAITVIWVGPDSANADVISKFVFKANLDQTVISGASNVQLAVTSIE